MTPAFAFIRSFPSFGIIPLAMVHPVVDRHYLATYLDLAFEALGLQPFILGTCNTYQRSDGIYFMLI